MRIGIGFDSHRLVTGRKLFIGGVEIAFDKGLLGHSDADVLCHAVIDALLGALGLGDIGKHFPDTDARWKGASGIDLLSRTVDLARQHSYEVLWIDSVVIAERPKLQPYIEGMKERMCGAGIPMGAVSIKAKTSEGMGHLGAGEGIAAHAVCLLKPAS